MSFSSSWTSVLVLLSSVFYVILRPSVLVLAALLCYHLPSCLYKTRLAVKGLRYLLCCHDKSWTVPEDPTPIFDAAPPGRIASKTVVFVRHGESTWNETFNQGSHRTFTVFLVGYLPNLCKAILYESYLLVTGKMDSWFYDAPLSELGLGQVSALGTYLARKPLVDDGTPESAMLALLRGDPGAPSSRLVSSNLRRALSTVAAGFAERLARRPNDDILVLPCLQEISRNPDTLSITPPHTHVTPSWIEQQGSTLCDFTRTYRERCDMSAHTGNKPPDTNGLKRMSEFCRYAFDDDDHAAIVCGGHSIWFRSFFQTFLPYQDHHRAKTHKIVNAGTVSFTLLRTETEQNRAVYMIDPQSVLVVYGGFS